jgi:hypothetical protein
VIAAVWKKPGKSDQEIRRDKTGENSQEREARKEKLEM